MFGFGKPRWSLSINSRRDEEYYLLESNSIGMLVGFVAIPIENGMRPSMDWVVEFRNKGGSSFRILPIWPNQYDPVAQIEERACSIDPKLVKAKSLPTFCRVDHTGKRIAKLSLEATINGVSARDIPLNDLVQRAAEGKDITGTESIYQLLSRVFCERYDPNRESVLLNVDR